MSNKETELLAAIRQAAYHMQGHDHAAALRVLREAYRKHGNGSESWGAAVLAVGAL